MLVWSYPYLIIAMVVSFGLHFVILYVKFLADIFIVKALDFKQWMLVLAFSVPVIFIDEILKFILRTMMTDHEQEGAKETHVQWIQKR